ncbi:MAG: radical SAM protein [Actinomycetota bacterium]|nr:radical SAM protein [Actinomycetota bacterium]
MDYLYDLSRCVLCPHECSADRLNQKNGFCRAGNIAEVNAYMAHHGEEPELSGTMGSGTIFFSKCNMACVYCQNYQISQENRNSDPEFFDTEKLAELMFWLKDSGCHNINLVSPTIWAANIKSSLEYAGKRLDLPVVYNTGGYDKPETIKMLKGLIQIYMPDMRYASNTFASRYSDVKDYVTYNRASVKEMYEQVGNLVTDKNNIAQKGLIIRLLVLPNNISEVKKSLDFIKSELTEDVYISIMSQYHPIYKACKFPELNRHINFKEYMDVIRYAEKLGFSNGSFQEFNRDSRACEDPYTPDFSKENVFNFNRQEEIK